jgi:hypothetical protein
LERWDGVMWTGLIWLRIGTGGELLWIRYWTFGFLEMLGNYRVASQPVASWVLLSSIVRLLLNSGFSPTNFHSAKCSKSFIIQDW